MQLELHSEQSCTDCSSFHPQIRYPKKIKDCQVQITMQKQKSDDASKKLQDEIQFINAQKVYIFRSYVYHICFSLNKSSLVWTYMSL